jgi:hypothetical protein
VLQAALAVMIVNIMAAKIIRRMESPPKNFSDERAATVPVSGKSQGCIRQSS